MKQIPDGVTPNYQQQFRRCGNPRCKCASTQGHGPYWYAFWREGSRVRSHYIGKTLPADTETTGSDQDGTTRQDAISESHLSRIGCDE